MSIIDEFRRRAIGLDTETHLIQDGLLAPPLVCGSVAGPHAPEGQLLDRPQTIALFTTLRRSSDIIVGANIAYDMAVLAAQAYECGQDVGDMVLREIFEKYDRDEVYDILIAEALNAIAGGHLFSDPKTGGPLLDGKGKQSARYSLEICVKQNLGRDDAKVNDFWRLRYAILGRLPVAQWPVDAVQYPKDDARNTLDVAFAQVGGRETFGHTWGPDQTCTVCSAEVSFGTIPPCTRSRLSAGHENLHDMPSQARSAFALHLASVWGLRAGPEQVKLLEERVVAERAREAARWQDLGLIGDEGKADGKEKKTRMAMAYGAAGECPACLGTGKVTSPISGNKVNCTAKVAVEFFCDGTGLDLDKAPYLPRTPTGGIAAGRDELRESGDEDLMAFADYSEDDRIITTYLPFLKKAAVAPVNVRPNVLLATGRTSYDGIMQTMPRDSHWFCFTCGKFSDKCRKSEHVGEVTGVRECFEPRDDSFYCSTDYSSGELCTLAQVCLWTVGYSRMAEIINETKDPGMLHTALAAKMIGATVDEFYARMKAGDKAAKGFRQAAKAANFGFPGGMGAAKFVLSKRSKKEGMTTGLDGRIYAGIRFCILLDSAERCGVELITEWRGRPCTPVCRRCCAAAENLKQEWLRQWSEMPRYFSWINDRVEGGGKLTQFVSDRVRGEVGFCDGANTLFQGLLADGAKRALWYITRECYTVKSSPLYGSRVVAFFHDEVFSEVLKARASAAGIRQAALMIEGLKEYVPDVHVACEPALMRRWTKGAETKFVDGILVPFDT